MSDISHTKLRRLDVTLLMVFLELMRHRKLTTVAERLGLTQSAISHSLRRLREAFGDQLFLRLPTGVEPTGRARMLEPKVSAIIGLLIEALDVERGFDAMTDDRVVTIAALDYEESLFAAPLIERLREMAPQVRVVFRSSARKAALEQLSEGNIDLAIGFFPALAESFEASDLYSERYSVIARKGHRIAKGALTVKRYAACDHLLVSIGGDLRGVVDLALRQQGLERRVVAAVPLFLPALSTVAGTDLICTVPARLAARYADRYGLVVREAPLDIRPFTVRAVWHRRSSTDPGMQWFREQLRQAMGAGKRS